MMVVSPFDPTILLQLYLDRIIYQYLVTGTGSATVRARCDARCESEGLQAHPCRGGGRWKSQRGHTSTNNRIVDDDSYIVYPRFKMSNV